MSTQLPAVIVKLSISILSNTRQDPGITEGVKALHKLTGKAGRWVKYKLPDEALAAVRKAASGVRQVHYELTLPWEEGYSMLPAKGRTHYDTKIADARAEFNAAVDAFVEAYPGWIEQAKLMHGDTFNASDYPNPENVRDEFRITLNVYPMPSASHFDAEMRGLYGETLEAANQQRVEAAVVSLWHRVIDPIKKMADTLQSQDAIFRDTLVDNVRDVLKIIPALNLTNDAGLLAATAEIEMNLSKLNPDTLRENRTVRKQAAAAAAAIVQKFGNLGGRKFAA